MVSGSATSSLWIFPGTFFRAWLNRTWSRDDYPTRTRQSTSVEPMNTAICSYSVPALPE